MAAPGRARRETEPVRITTAPTSHRDDIDRRRRRYIISMGIRTLCFVGAVLVGDNWLRWVLVAGAFILPYVAVVMANTASPRIEGADLMAPSHGHKELGHNDPGHNDPDHNDPDHNDPGHNDPGRRDFGQ